jgi:hypothetical protein
MVGTFKHHVVTFQHGQSGAAPEVGGSRADIHAAQITRFVANHLRHKEGTP